MALPVWDGMGEQLFVPHVWLPRWGHTPLPCPAPNVRLLGLLGAGLFKKAPFPIGQNEVKKSRFEGKIFIFKDKHNSLKVALV
jgi:hypothetical protein